MSMSFSLHRLVNAIFNGAPANENVAPYTAQVTSLISLYICFIALFLLALFVRRLQKRLDTTESSKSFWIWMAAAMAFSILWIAGYIVYSLAAGDG
jgi:hypothetical protein